jgi:hypothetical protein
MNMSKLGLLLLALSPLCGCGVPFRYQTTLGWYPPPPADPAGAPASTPAAEATRSQLYVTYWDGKCCFKGSPKVVRCTLQSDNTLACVEEVEANKVMSE